MLLDYRVKSKRQERIIKMQTTFFQRSRLT